MKTHAQVRDHLGFHKCNPSALQTTEDMTKEYIQKEGFGVYKGHATKYPDSNEDLDFNYF